MTMIYVCYFFLHIIFSFHYHQTNEEIKNVFFWIIFFYYHWKLEEKWDPLKTSKLYVAAGYERHMPYRTKILRTFLLFLSSFLLSSHMQIIRNFPCKGRKIYRKASNSCRWTKLCSIWSRKTIKVSMLVGLQQRYKHLLES